MIATVPGWPTRPILLRTGIRIGDRLRAGANLFGRALEVAGLVIFVAVIGTVPAIVAVFAG